MKNQTIRTLCLVSAFFILHSSFAAETNGVAAVPASSSMPDVAGSLARVIGALAVVIGIFLAGVWVVRNWQRLMIQRGRAPKLNIIEVRSLGGRQAIYVVAYEQERMLLASSPNGISLITHLPSANGEVQEEIAPVNRLSFTQSLAQVLKGK